MIILTFIPFPIDQQPKLYKVDCTVFVGWVFDVFSHNVDRMFVYCYPVFYTSLLLFVNRHILLMSTKEINIMKNNSYHSN